RMLRMQEMHSPLHRYMRRSLHRRLFVWFGASIFVSVFAVVGIASTFGGSGKQERARIANFVGHEFAQVWDRPVERDALAARMSHDLDLGVRVEDAGGGVLSADGPACEHPFDAAVEREGANLGRVRVCVDWRVFNGGIIHLALPLFVACTILWAAS